MRITVLAHVMDANLLQAEILGDSKGLNNSLFPIHVEFSYAFVQLTPHSGGKYTLSSNHTISSCPENSKQLSQTRIREHISKSAVVIVIAGENAVRSSEVENFLSGFLRNERADPADSRRTRAVILVQCALDRLSTLDLTPRDAVFVVPHSGQTVTARSKSRKVLADRVDILRALQTISENQTLNPNVGFGLLLIGQDGRFFLMERLRGPGLGTLGTVGGNFRRGETIESQLETILTKRFTKPPRVELGPLLACTSMRSSYHHYIDLTFLATTNNTAALQSVTDRGLGVVNLNLLKGKVSKRRSQENRYLFSFSEMAQFYHRDLLFQPVRNAFESLSRRIIAYESTRGRHQRIQLPSLLKAQSAIEIPGLDDQAARIQLQKMMTEWSDTALPFFQGDF